MKHRTFKDFAELLIIPVLGSLSPRVRLKLLIEIYGLAIRRSNMEQAISDVKKRPSEVRPRRIKMRNVRSHILKAIAELKIVLESTEPGDGLARYWGVGDMIVELAVLAELLKGFEDVFAGDIPAELQTSEEARSPWRAVNHESLFLDMKSTTSEFWFIVQVEQLLLNVKLENGARFSSTDIDRIISRAFDAAFNISYPVATVKTNRVRLSKRPDFRNRLLQFQKP